MTNKPTIIFVHGAWHSPEFFSRTIALLEPLGYKCVALSMPAVRQNPRVTSLDEDISTLRAAVEKEFELGNDVAVHAHSWGGVATGCSMDGFSKAEREAVGKQGAVVNISLVSTGFIPVGSSLEDTMGGRDNRPSFWELDEDETTVWAHDFQGLLYHDLEPTDAEYWVSLLKPHTFATFQDKAKSSPHKTIPVSYLICEEDRAIPLQVQEGLISLLKESGLVVTEERLKSGHSPHLSQPDSVAGFVQRAAVGPREEGGEGM